MTILNTKAAIKLTKEAFVKNKNTVVILLYNYTGFLMKHIIVMYTFPYNVLMALCLVSLFKSVTNYSIE